MAFSDKQEFRIPRHIVQPGAVNIETITADKTLDYRSATYQIITSDGGSQNDLNLPEVVNGAMFWVKTKAASNQNLRVMSGASPVATLTAAGQSALFVCDGSVWDVVFHG